jgi:hypothetical protein
MVSLPDEVKAELDRLRFEREELLDAIEKAIDISDSNQDAYYDTTEAQSNALIVAHFWDMRDVLLFAWNPRRGTE